ncbi:DMT family transporter [Kribbella sp. NPDC048915]|uniref:DMT family transporter n=1 Tax=Kribbella sp. NPDC048915 TaxID=3155148 RepID=UPI0033ED8A18
MASLRARLALLTPVVLWAAAFPAIRVGLDGLGPGGLAVLRLAVASLCLAVVAPFAGLRRPAARHLPLIAAAGLTGVTGYNLLLNWGEVTVPAGTASFIVVTNPIYSAVLAVALLRERLLRRQVIGAAVALVGVAAITLLGNQGSAGIDSSALIVVCAAIAFGVYHVVIKPLLRHYSGLEVTAYATWAGTLFLVPAAPSLLSDLPHADAEALTAAVLLGVAPSALGYVSWAYAVARLPVTVATSSLYLVPPIAVVVGFVWLGEVPQPVEIAGGLVAIAGVAYASGILHSRRGAPNPTSPNKNQKLENSRARG